MAEDHFHTDVYAWEERVLNFVSENAGKRLVECEFLLLDQLQQRH